LLIPVIVVRFVFLLLFLLFCLIELIFDRQRQRLHTDRRRIEHNRRTRRAARAIRQNIRRRDSTRHDDERRRGGEKQEAALTRLQWDEAMRTSRRSEIQSDQSALLLFMFSSPHSSGAQALIIGLHTASGGAVGPAASSSHSTDPQDPPACAQPQNRITRCVVYVHTNDATAMS
jgi:hypothetical protein